MPTSNHAGPGRASLALGLYAVGAATILFSLFLAVASFPDRVSSIPGILLAGFGAAGVVAGVGAIVDYLAETVHVLREMAPRINDIAVATRRTAAQAERPQHPASPVGVRGVEP